MKFYKDFTPFQKGFFLIFTIASIITFLLPVLVLGKSVSAVFSILGILGLISTLSGILVSIYTAKASIAGYMWWWINTISFAIIALASHLYGQFIQNIFILLPLQIYGFIAWKMDMKKNQSDEIAIRRFNSQQKITYIGGAIICFILYGIFLWKLPYLMLKICDIKIAKDPQIILDSITSTLTIMAVYLTGKRFIEQWNFWLVSNSLGLIMFVIQTLRAGVSNTAMFVGD
ncbi:MAG: nicotinamide riboside transporter PnuC, partial [Sarcina sp.]